MMRNKYVNIIILHIPRASMPGWACLCRASITCNSWTNKVLDQQSLNKVVNYNFSRVYLGTQLSPARKGATGCKAEARL